MKIKFFIVLALTIFLFFLFSYLINSAFAQERVLQSLEKSITSLVESTKPSLVTIEGEVRKFPHGLLSYYMKGLKDSSYFTPSFVGSGVIYSADGYILTTTSVVQGMDRLKVVMPNGKKSEAKLVGTDDQSNIAVLKVDAGSLKPVKLGNSDRVKPGSWVTVVGNSYGLPTAVSFGVVNGVREDGFIQMSVSVSPGNSGGPVLSTDGSVVGLVSARLAEQSYIDAMRLFNEANKERSTLVIPPREIELPTSGVSLAVPINKAKATAKDIIKHGTIQRGYLGIYPEDDEDGVLVLEVVKDSPAEKAGLRDGDIIIEYNGKRVKSEKQLRELIGNTRPEEMVRIIVLRDVKQRVINAVISRAKPLFGKFSDQFLQIPPEAPEAEVPDFEIPEAEYYYDVAKYKEAQEVYKEEIKKLKQDMEKISREMERLSEELKKAKEKEGKL
jgi:serine protease Do